MRNPEPVLILGASSDMARAMAHRFARAGHPVLLAARDVSQVEGDVPDLQIRYQATARALAFDAADFASHPAFIEALDPFPGIVCCVFGYLGDQKQAEEDWEMTRRIIEVNFMGAVSLLNLVATQMVERGAGTIIGISSVAGDRGRGSNYLYGSAKAGFSAYLSGLRNRLYGEGIHVLTVKPGFVHTAMTEQLDLPKALTAQPAQVAEDIYRAFKKKKNVLYTRWFWRYIMWVITAIPEGIFKRLKL